MTEQMNVPKLRFNEFEGNWSKNPLGQFCEHITYGLTVRPKFVESGIPLISAREIKSGTIKYSDAPQISMNDFNSLSDKAKPVAGDLFLSKTGSIGFSAKHTLSDPIAITQNIAVIRFIDEDIIEPDYVLHYFKTRYFYCSAISRVNQSTIMDLQLGDIKKLLLPIPPNFSEQQKIASFLSTVDKKIELLTEKKSKLTEYKKGVMQQLFNGRFEISEQSTKDGKITFIPPTLRFKSDDGSEFPDWEENILGDIIEFFNGKGHEQHIDAQGEYVVVNSKFVASQSLVKKFCNELIFPLNESDITMVMSDVPNGKALAKCYLIPESNRYTLNQRICALRSNGLVINQYLIYQLNRNSFYLKFDTGVGQTNLKKNDVLSCPLSTPNIEEQTKIANFLVATDRKIELANSELEKAKQWKKGLLQQMFV